ncbi:MAG: FtsQ-type POTRA domain-containing protein [Ruminococcaceae bacterium]|nr:FtsQ-type POTRA domain-containing protein [Oscillospiraceae bacterium]
MKETRKEWESGTVYDIYNDVDGGFRRLKQKNTARHIRQRIYYVVLLTFLLLIFILGAVAIFFRITEIEVKGNSAYKKEEIITSSGISEGMNIYLFREGDVQKEILTKHPYVRTVSVKRDVPNTVTIDLQCEDAGYYIEIGGEYFVISNSLRVLERFYTFKEMEEAHPEIKHFKACAVKSAIVGSELEFITSGYSTSAKEVLKVLEESDVYSDVTSIHYDDRFNIGIVYQERLKANIGNGEDAELKLRFMREIIKDLGNARGTIDIKDVETAYVLLDSDVVFD